MKSILVASLTLVATLSLTGCASTNSAELIEYQECLKAQHSFYLLQLEKSPYMTPSTFQQMEERWEAEGRIVFDFAKEECAKYRP